MSMVNWCCQWFAQHFDQQGRRGPAVAMQPRQNGGIDCVLQYRAVAIGDLGAPETSAAVPLIYESHISYCPWCGRQLDRHYKRQLKKILGSAAR
jgi:hypothetical protein